MKPIKTIMEFLITGCVCTALLILPMTLQTEAEAKIDSPCAGVGRIAQKAVETPNYTPETETAEIEPYITPETQEEKDNETIYQYTEVYPVVEEEYVEVLPDLDPIIETDIDALIVQIAGEYGLPWELVRAVVWAESTFNVYALSDTYDYGLMQVSYIVWNGLDSSLDRYDPETNLRVGCEVLKSKIDASGGDFANGLTRYRFGDGGAMQMWSQGQYSNWYNERVLGKYYEYLRGEN